MKRYQAPDEISKEKNSMEPMAFTLPNQVRPPSLQEMFAMYLRQHADEEVETPEEADDFDPDWDEDTLDMSPYELYMVDRDDNPPGADPDAPLPPDPAKEVPTPSETTDAAPDGSGTLSAKESSAT